MPDQKPNTSEALLLRAKASGHQRGAISGAIREFTNNELVHLLTRVIALENLVISLFADASKQQLERAREMANFISPRPDFTPHPRTIHAATQMIDIVNRSNYFRGQEHVASVSTCVDTLQVHAGVR